MSPQRAVDDVEALPRSASLQRLRRRAFERGAISGRDDPIIVPERVDPRLHQIRGLREDEPSAAGLVVWKRALDRFDQDGPRRRRQRELADARERECPSVRDDDLMMRRDACTSERRALLRSAGDDEDVHRRPGRSGGPGRPGRPDFDCPAYVRAPTHLAYPAHPAYLAYCCAAVVLPWFARKP